MANFSSATKILQLRIERTLFLLLCAASYLNAQDRPSISVVDDLGRTLTLPAIPQRIVSLAPSITETLFAIGAGAQVAGITLFCDFPAEALEKPRVGGLINPNYELIISADADLVIMSVEGNKRDAFEQLIRLQIPVFVTNPRTLDGIFKSIHDLGALTGHLRESRDLVQQLEGRLQALLETPKLAQKPKVLIILSIQPIITAGKGNFMDELLNLAGGENVGRAGDIAYPLLNREQIFASRPDIMLVLSDAAESVEGVMQSFREWRSVPAVRNKRVHLIDADPISRPGPRILDGLERVFRLLRL